MATYSSSDPSKPVAKPGVPTGYESAHDFLKEMRERRARSKAANQHNEDAGKDDAKFTVGDQWDSAVRAKRVRQHKPVMTVNRLIAFVGQVVGNRLMNETEIRVFPDKGGTKEVAKIREGLIRSIYKNSSADLARDEALKYQVIGGQGAFCLSIDYAGDDVFDQQICIKHTADPYSITFDELATEPTGGDAEWGMVEDDIPTDAFKARHPKAARVSFADDGDLWFTEDSIRVVNYWRMVTEGTKTLALFQDGTTHDVTEMEEFEYADFVAQRPDGSPYTREVPNRFARLYICSGADILEGPYDYKISSLPIYRVPGWEVNDGEKLHRWGLVRFLKDPQRLHNYWRSTIAEQLVAAPRNKWLTTPQAVLGHEKRWRDAPSSDDPFLFMVDGEREPTHVPPPGIDAALITEAGMATQDIRDVSNIHEAALGMQSNEVSGKAIQARQTVSDVGTFVYHDRLRLADERCARNINELIPQIYDTQRIVTIIGADNKATLTTINDPMDPNSDVTLGKYGVTVTVGPATVTKRALAAEQMMAFVNAIPEKAGEVMDLVADAQDWPKSDEFARRFRMSLPPGFIPQDELTPEMIQVQQQSQQMQQMQQQLEMANAQAQLAKMEADAALAQAKASQAEALAYKAIADAEARTKDVNSKADEREIKQIMAGLDQHNDMVDQDRKFDLDERGQASKTMLEAKKLNQPKSNGSGNKEMGNE